MVFVILTEIRAVPNPPENLLESTLRKDGVIQSSMRQNRIKPPIGPGPEGLRVLCLPAGGGADQAFGPLFV